MSRKVYTIVLDWDGTMVENKWPDMGPWMPGAVDAVKALHRDGNKKFVVHSCRLSPYDPFTFQKREPANVAAEVQQVRARLDAAGLHFVDIWQLPGKPGGYLYIDDRAERYQGSTKSWEKMIGKVRGRCGDGEQSFPHFEQEVANGRPERS